MVKQLIEDEKARKSTYKRRMVVIKKKTKELATLCGARACAVVFGPDGEVDTWPENPAAVKAVVDMYKNHGKKPYETESKTASTAACLDEKRERIERVEREIAAAKEENRRKVLRVAEAMSRVLSEGIEWLEQSKAEEGGETETETKTETGIGIGIDSMSVDVGKRPIFVNPEILTVYRNLFGSIFAILFQNFSRKSICCIG